MITIALLVFFISVAVYFYLIKNKNGNRPPGPIPLPFFGNLHEMGSMPHLAFVKYYEKYGPVVSVRLGSKYGISISGSKLIKETLSNPLFSGRDQKEADVFVTGDKYGLVQSTGEIWVEQRRFALRNLRDFGFGKGTMEELIIEEVKEVIERLKKLNNDPVELQRKFSLAVVNSLWKILTGVRFDHDDEKLISILDQIESSSNALLNFKSWKAILIFFYPKIAQMFPNFSGWNNLEKNIQPRLNLFKQSITEHIDSLPEDSARDFVDVYLKEINRTTDPKSSFHPSLGIHSLRSVMSDLFVAGSDTTSVTLTWAMIYLVHNPRVQKKLHDELDRVLGKRLPSLADRKNLPYTEAVIHETLRMSSIAPFGVPHATTEDVKLQGYDIPKGAIVFSNFYQVHHDPSIWGDPQNFRPERFLNDDETIFVKNENLFAFSVGKRVCLGELLARDTLFLFVAALGQEFLVSPLNDGTKPSLAIKEGTLTLAPKSSLLIMRERS